MNNYHFELVGKNEAYKSQIWPMGRFDLNEIVFIGDTNPFKIFVFWYQPVLKTLQKYPENERNFYLTLLGLSDDERVMRQPWRSWNQLGFGVCWRATLAVGLLEKKRIISLPNFDFATKYWALPLSQDIWQYLQEQGYIVLVPSDTSSWLVER